MAACCLFLGNFLLLYTCAAACAKKGMAGSIRYTPLMPLYWLVTGIAAWKGALQLIWSPHYWEKTEHHEGD
jgi:glycosyltransferase XagB